MDEIAITADGLSAGISPDGAELRGRCDADGRELMWDGDPAVWSGRAPILFPIVGRAADDTIRVDGRAFPINQHGFARRSRFELVEQDDAATTLRLEASEATRAHYPFDFALTLRFAIADATLTVTATVDNPAERELPVSFGYHPAFRWPLPFGRPREAHVVRFDQGEQEPIRRIDGDGLVLAEPQPSPIHDGVLPLDDALFADGALIFDRLWSRKVTFGAPGAPAIEVAFEGLPELGLWTKPGAHADYLCIEPWAGHADPVGYTGEYRDKPAITRVPPHGARRFTMRITLVPEMPA